MLRVFIQAICLFLPWKIRRLILNMLRGFSIHRDAHIGLSLIFADECILSSRAHVGHFNYIGRLDRLYLGEDAFIGNFNWIAGLSHRLNSPFFRSRSNRRSELIMGDATLLTHQHYIDCTDRVELCQFSAIAGYRSQLITHGVNPMSCKQTCSPITIGAYTMVGSGAIILQGVHLPDRCVVASGSVVTHVSRESYSLIGGNPAVHQRSIPEKAKLFARTTRTVM
ncbi:acyltransferase [Bradyrhizobium sp. RDT46]|uniref:acyltransferase n=1 Tax=Bradyrhizobium sp. RDT46 TaxID=3341829 RepID=UPI0035C67214